jgi:Helix-turn-helix domain
VSVRLEGLDDLVREAVRAELAAIPSAPVGWLDVPAAAAHLSTSEVAIRSMIKRGDLVPKRTPNGRLLFRAADLDEWVTSGLDPDRKRS